MAKCELSTEKYISVVKNLIKLNPSEYKNFDKTAEFILKSGLSNYEKSLSLFSIAEIYIGLHGLDKSFYTIGKANKIVDAQILLEDTDEFVSIVSDLYKVKKTPKVKIESIEKMINDLSSKTVVTPNDLTGTNGVLTAIKNYFNTIAFDDETIRQGHIDNVSAQLKSILRELNTSDAYKDLLLKSVDATISSLTKISPFISLRDIADLAELNNQLVTLVNGQMIEAVPRPDGLYIIDELGNEQRLAEENFIASKDARNDDYSNSNNGKQEFFEDTILSNFKIKPLENEVFKREAIIAKLKKMGDAVTAGIKVHAVKISTVGDERLQRIHDIANDPKYKGLANRTYETFENETQVNYLKSTPNGTVITVARPKQSESKFVLVGEIIGSGEKFYLYPLDNYVFLNSNNTTQQIDFTNPVHLEMVKEHSIKRTSEGVTELTRNDLETLKNTYNLHNIFKENLNTFLSDKFNDETSSVDVSEQFFSQYSINSQRVGDTIIQNLADLIDTDKSLSRKLTIVTVDTFGKTIKEEERNLVFMFTKFNDYKDASGNYKPKDEQNKFQLVNLLDGNERIKIINAEGEEIDTVTQQEYLDNHFDSSIKMNDNYIKEKVFGGKFYENQNHIIIRFNNNKTYGYKIVKPVYFLEQTQGFATFLNTLTNVLTAPDKSSQLRTFNKQQFKFANFSSISGKVELFTNFTVDQKGNLQIEIRPSNIKEGSKYGFISKLPGAKSAFNFSLAENEKDLIKDNAKTKDLISKVVAENIIFSKLDLNKLKDVTKFYSLLNQLSKDNKPSENVVNLIDAIETQQNNFSKLLNEKVIEKMLKVGALYPGFIENFNRDYPNPKHLILDIKEDGKEIPRIIFADKNESQAKKDYIKSASSLELHDVPQKKLVITSKSPVNTVTKIANVPLAETTEHPIENISVSKPTLYEQMFGKETIAEEETDLSDDIPEIDLFSISNGAVQTETQAERENAVQWLQNNLPQFEISQEELSTIIDLSKIDGNVLGLFKDRVIHLNNEILSKGVVYHEAFHGVFRYLMTPEQQSKLIEQVTSNVKNNKLFTESALKAFASERNYIYDYEKMKELQAEEILADGFQNHMIKNTKPKGLLEQLYSLLKKLIDMFIKHGNVIDSTYKNIQKGAYSKVQIQSEIYEGQTAYALIPGLKLIEPNNKNISGVSQRQSTLQKDEQNQLVYMVSKYVIEDTSGKTFDEKFENSRHLILKQVYNLDQIINNKENKKFTRDEIVKEFGNLYSNYRFMLGARTLGETIYDVNVSGISKFDKKILPNKIKQYKDKSLDNELGQESLEVLKKLVKEKTRELYSMLDGVGNTISKDTLAKELSGANEFKSQVNDDAENDEELSDDVNTEEEFGQHNRLDSAPRQVRRFLAIVDYNKKDAKTGITVPRVINGESIFGTLLKITSDVKVDQIINHIRVTANTYREDGNFEAAGDLQAIYDKIHSYTDMDENGNPATNKELYNMFKDVLHGTETNYIMSYVTLTTGTFEEEGNNISSFTLSDRVMQADIVNKRRNLISSMITTHAKKHTDEDYLIAAKRLIDLSTKIIDTPVLMGSSKLANDTLETLTFDLYNAFNDVGMTLPKSLIKMSLLAIDKINNNNNALTNVNKNTLDHYDTNRSLILEGDYLQKDYFRDIKAIYKTVIDESISSNNFGKMLDDKNKTLNRFFSITNKFTKYIIKYDATDLPSVFRNAAGKPVYRYTKYTPLHTIAQSIRQEGLLDTFKKDRYYNDFLESFYSDNPLFSDLLKGSNTKQAKVAKLLMDNMSVSLFGGIAQFNNQTYKDGKTFGKLDDQSLHIMSILSFLQRSNISSTETIIDEDGNVTTPKTTIQTYMRSFDTLEASQTNFLITALYQQYADTKGIVKNSNNHYKIVDDLEAKVKQEFNRIKKEWNRRTESKTNYDNGTSNKLVPNYNAILDKTDKTKAIVESKNNKEFRAYNFNVLPYFFSAPENELFTNSLIQLAKDNTVNFEDLDENILSELRDGLNNYAQKELNIYIDKLKDLGVVKEHEETVKAIKKDTTTGAVILENGNAVVTETKQPSIKYLTSNLIADTLKIDYETPMSLSNVYAKTKENYNFRGDKEQKANIEGLLADHFFNNWYNSLNTNEIFTGDRALNVKDGIDATKRNKKFLATGSTMKEGFHRVAYLNTIEGYVNNEYPEYGPYYSASEVLSDFKITDPSIKKYIYENYNANDSDIYEIFDGQSISSLFHQADMNDSLGRLTPKILKSIIAKHYRKLTEEEVRNMEKNKIVNNPKKTVTASRNIYHKLSEIYIDRNYVSRLIIPAGSTKEQVYEQLHSYYTTIYATRKEIQEYSKINKDTKSNDLDSAIADLEKYIQNTYTDIHKFYKPLKHRVKLHNMLNSMEYHNVDQLMDTTASKNATMLPVDYFAHENNGDYLPLNLSSIEVNNEDKYLQVETSGVHDTARFSVQGKILIAADLQHIEELANKRHEAAGTTMSSTERKAMNDIGNVLVKYQESLFDIADSNLQSLKHFLRKGENFELGKIFNLIRENLESQNAPESMLKLFSVDNSGKPVHNANLPGIRSMLEYYFFSLYSKHVTDERGSGFKNIHVSSFGYNVLEDEYGNVITTEEYQNNPDAYPNVKDRPLTVHIENIYNDAGEVINKRYLVECILPKQFFKNEQHEKFYLDNLTEMFALRIPTEDKRSMIALKVVDYVDSSNLNTIVVPQFIHLLSGSDFDIDSLYGQTYAHYVNVIGNYNKFGEYDSYASSDKGKFIEFLHYKMEDEDLKPLVKAKRKEIINSKSFEPSANTLEIMYGLGFNEADYLYIKQNDYFKNVNTDDNLLSNEIDQLRDSKEIAKQAFIQAKEDNEIDSSDYTAKKNKEIFGKIDYDVKVKLEDKFWLQKFVKGALRVEAALQVFEKYGLPVDQKNFDKNIVNHLSVLPIHQNKNLKAKIDILSNESVFKNLYIHERSSVEAFAAIAKAFGIDLDNFGIKTDPNTITSLVNSKSLGSSYKDGIGITASLQKFLALASQYGLELNGDNIIWKYKSNKVDNLGNKKEIDNLFSKFGSINVNGDRVIEINGNILGMFADGMKKPIPAALQMNEVNAGITLAMIGVGLDPAFAFGFNFIPEIKKAIYNIQASRFAISDSTSSEYKFLNNELSNVMKSFVEDNGGRVLLKELVDANLITPESHVFKIQINKQHLMIDFAANKLDEYKLQNNTLTVNEIGFDVSSVVGDVKTELSSEAQKLILLQLYKEQSQQAWSLRNAGSIVDLYKKLNPSLVSFDKLMKNINELKDGTSIFTAESTDKLFTNKQVWVPLKKAIDDLNEQSVIFLERTSFFKPIANTFGTVFTDPSNIARTITSFIGIRKYQMNQHKNSVGTDPIAQANFDLDNAQLKEVFTADYLFNNTLEEKLDALKNKHPKNKFLQYLKPANNKTVILNENNKPVTEKTLQMVSKAKIAGDLANDIVDDANNLYRDETLFMKELFYHELAITGLQYKSGSFLQYLPSELQIPISENITEFITAIENTKGNKKELVNVLREYISSDETKTNEDVYKLFDELFVLMAFNASKEVGNKKIKQVSKISFSEAEGFESGIMKKLKFSTTDSKERVEIANKVVGNILGLNILKSGKSFTLSDKLGAVPLEEITINMKGADAMPEMSNDVAIEIGKKLNILKDKDDKNKYKFPLLLKIGATTYLLQGIDNEIDNKSFGKSIIDSIAGVGEYKTVGNAAKYVALPKELTSGTINPIGYNTSELKRYTDLINRKIKLPVVKEFDLGEAMSEGLTADMFEDYSVKQASPINVAISENKKEFVDTVTYTPQGKETQTYTIKDGNIFNSKNVEVFKTDSIDRNKILANLDVKIGRGVVVTHKDAKYVVSLSNGTITSVTSGKIMQWQENNGDRKAILDLAGIGNAEPLSKLELDIQNINVTFDMVKHFYDQSATGKLFDAYSTEFAAYAANLKTTGMTNNEIIEKLKCL